MFFLMRSRRFSSSAVFLASRSACCGDWHLLLTAGMLSGFVWAGGARPFIHAVCATTGANVRWKKPAENPAARQSGI